jgi:uncharacterized protein (TIGR04255 family)
MRTEENPLVDPSPKEIALPRAPLHRVIAQVRFPIVAAIDKRDFIAPFQEELRADYPVLRQEQTQHVLIGVQPDPQVPAVTSQAAWRFFDAANIWRLSLTPTFLALETKVYTSRSDFLGRLKAVLVVLGKHVKPGLVDRLGLRYIDRLTGEELGALSNLVRSEIRGVGGTPLGEQIVHSITETVFKVDGARILARWGSLPANRTTDPGAITPIGEASWILDLDMYSTKPVHFDVEVLDAKAREFAERLYAVFRWSVTEDFLRRFGAEGAKP